MRGTFIGAAVKSTLYNLERYGSYEPWAGKGTTFDDGVLLRVFHLLQADHDAGGSPPIEAHADTWGNTVMDWGDEACLAPCFSRVVLRVSSKLEARPERVAELWAMADASKEASGKSPLDASHPPAAPAHQSAAC